MNFSFIFFPGILLSQLALGQVVDGRDLKPQVIQAKNPKYSGRVEARGTVQQLAPFAGKTLRLLVEAGSSVKKGDAILEIVQRSSEGSFSRFTERANLSGLLDNFQVVPGENFNNSSPLFTLLDTSKHRIKIAVSGKDLPSITIKGAVLVFLDSEAEPFTGEVVLKSLLEISRTGLYRVEVEVPNSLPIGSFCELEFLTNRTASTADSRPDIHKVASP